MQLSHVWYGIPIDIFIYSDIVEFTGILRSTCDRLYCVDVCCTRKIGQKRQINRIPLSESTISLSSLLWCPLWRLENWDEISTHSIDISIMRKFLIHKGRKMLAIYFSSFGFWYAVISFSFPYVYTPRSVISILCRAINILYLLAVYISNTPYFFKFLSRSEVWGP